MFLNFLAWLGPSEVKIKVFSVLYCPKEQSTVRFAVYPKRRSYCRLQNTGFEILRTSTATQIVGPGPWSGLGGKALVPPMVKTTSRPRALPYLAPLQVPYQVPDLVPSTASGTVPSTGSGT